MERVCPICERSMKDRRAHAICCSGPCRAARSRLLRILNGEVADGCRSVRMWADQTRMLRKRTHGSPAGSTDEFEGRSETPKQAASEVVDQLPDAMPPETTEK